MSRRYERVFEVSVPVDRAFQAQTDPDEISKWFAPIHRVDDTTMQVEPPVDVGLSAITVEEYELNHRLVYTEPPDPGKPFPTQVTIVYEEIETGTRVTFTRAGFDDGQEWDPLFEAMAAGTDESLADLILYLETGVAFPRHFTERSYAGLDQSIDSPAGLRIVDVDPESFAARLGLQAGDILVELGGAPVFARRDLFFFTREHAGGEQASAAWVRDRATLMRGTAQLGTRPPQRALEADVAPTTSR